MLRAVIAGCLMLGLFGHYRATTPIINSPSWQVFFVLLGFILLVIDRTLPRSGMPELPSPFERRADDDAPTRLDL
jgi:hypothetical protein